MTDYFGCDRQQSSRSAVLESPHNSNRNVNALCDRSTLQNFSIAQVLFGDFNYPIFLPLSCRRNDVADVSFVRQCRLNYRVG